MPLIDLDRPRAVERIQPKLRDMQYLRGTGPVSMEFFQWVDETLIVLEHSFGETAAPVQRFLAAVGDRSPIYSQGIPPHGEWGLLARLDRAEVVLNDALEMLAAPATATTVAPKAGDDDAAAAPPPARDLPRDLIFGRDRPCPSPGE